MLRHLHRNTTKLFWSAHTHTHTHTHTNTGSAPPARPRKQPGALPSAHTHTHTHTQITHIPTACILPRTVLYQHTCCTHIAQSGLHTHTFTHTYTHTHQSLATYQALHRAVFTHTHTPAALVAQYVPHTGLPAPHAWPPDAH